MPKKPKPGLRMKETLWGYVAPGVEDFKTGYEQGEAANIRFQFWVTIDIDEFEEFIKISGRTAPLSGTVSCPLFGKNLPIRDGRFNLFQPDVEQGDRRITYTFSFTGQDGGDYYLDGFKVIYHDPKKVDLLEDMTTLFTRIFRAGTAGGELVASGILFYHVVDLPAMLASMEVTHAGSLMDQIRIRSQYFSFVYGEIRDTYMENLTPFYYTGYENLVFKGNVEQAGSSSTFFLFAGIHDKDFPWGDKATFWDLGLVIEEKEGRIQRFAASRRRMAELTVNIERGILRYKGDLFQILEGDKVSFSQMGQTNPPPHLRKVRADINLTFAARPFPQQHVPFQVLSNYDRIVDKGFLEQVTRWLPHFNTLGVHLTPHKVAGISGRMQLADMSGTATYHVDSQTTLGEAEVGSFQNIRKPTLYYNYFCALDPAGDTIKLHVRSDVLREDRRDFVADKVEEQIGRIINLVSWLDVEIKGKRFRVLPRDEGDAFPSIKRVLLQIDNDHYPTAVFQRRCVELESDTEWKWLALEENMDALNLGSIGSTRTACVAAIRHRDKFVALENALDASNFLEKLEAAWKKSGKTKPEYSIIIKPNFMFMYSLKDRSTFTDPELVEHLVHLLHEAGYRAIKVADARSTYGVFFTNREVKTVARYIGLDGTTHQGESYAVVDLSEDLVQHTFSGVLGQYVVNREWRDADFRISFAKNKTHSYAYYTLTIKCIYGALPAENKFKEYHHERDIFHTTIDFLKAFPVHFGIIDAVVSADGPFGIFADKDPNYTETVIAGDDIVAVDWVGASKMGLNPLVSDYMRLAVDAFGKPEIELIGDRTLYKNWVNVPDILSTVAFGLDRNYYFGNLFYSVFSTMDPFFQYKEESVMRRVIRVLNDPIRSIFFERIRQGVFDAQLNRKLYEMFTAGGL